MRNLRKALHLHGMKIMAIITLTFTFSCAEDDIIDNSNVQAPKVTRIVPSDVSDNGNGSDLHVSFNKASNEDMIKEYRIIVATSSTNMQLSLAQSLSEGRYTVVQKIGSNISVTLDAEILDATGYLLAEYVEYFVYVLSVADGKNAGLNSLATPPYIFKLS